MLRLLNMHRPASPTAIKIFLLVGFEICRDCTILMRELPLSLHALNAVAVSHSETSFRRLNNWNTMDLTYTGQFNRNTSAATNKKLIWLKVILLLHSFSQANVPVSLCCAVLFSSPYICFASARTVRLLVHNVRWNENFYFFNPCIRFGGDVKHLILFYFMCALVLNLFQIEMKMYCAGHSGHSLKKRVEFKHRFWCLTLVQFRFFLDVEWKWKVDKVAGLPSRPTTKKKQRQPKL